MANWGGNRLFCIQPAFSGSGQGSFAAHLLDYEMVSGQVLPPNPHGLTILMPLTAAEAAVVDRLRCLKVATMAVLRDLLDISHMTVVRALRKYGYFTSFNHNSSFYVLADTPRFDDGGLWWYRDVGFSRHGTLQATLLALIEAAAAGRTVAELETRLATPVGNLLSRLSAQGLIGRISVGRCAVYLAAEPGQQARQRASRAGQAAPAPIQPPDLPLITLIDLLVQLVRTPTASPASLSQTLQARGLSINAAEVRAVIDFYDLPQKGGPWPSRNSSPN